MSDRSILESGTAAAPEPAPTATPEDQAAASLARLSNKWGPETSERLLEAEGFARRVFGDEVESIAAQPDPDYGVVGSNPEWIEHVSDAARSFSALERVLGGDALELSLTQVEDTISEIRTEFGRELADKGHPRHGFLHRALDAAYRLRASKLATPEVPDATGADPIAAFRAQHATSLTDRWDPEHALRHRELEQLYTAKGGK